MIKLNRLVLNNFMCVERAELNFDEGVTLIVGKNGQGKSTVLQAVALCLLEEKRSDSYKEFIMLGKDSASLSLDAEVKGMPIKIDISLDKKQSGMTRTATYNGRIYRNSEVSDLLDQFDIAYYSDIIMSMQSEGDITKLKPNEREKYLQKLFQFDFTQKVEKLKTDLNSIKESIDYQTAQIDFNTKSIVDRKTEIRDINTLSFTNNDILELDAKAAALTKEVNLLSDELKERDRLTAEKTAIQSTQFTVQRAIDSAKHEIELIQSNRGVIDSLNEQINTLTLDIEAKKTELDGYGDTISKLNADLEKFNAEILETNGLVDAKKAEIVSVTESKKTADQDYATSIADVRHAQKHLDMIKLGTCPECGHTFDRTDVSKYNATLETANTVSAEKKAIVDGLDKKLTELNAELVELNKKSADTSNNVYTVKANIKLEEDRKNICEGQIKSINDNIASLKSQIEQYSSKTDKLPEIQHSIDEQTKILEKIQSDIRNLDESLRKIASVSQEYTTKQNELNALQQKLSEYNSELAQNNAILQNNETIRKSIESMENAIEESKKSVENYRRQKATYDEAINLLDKTFPAWLILKTCQMLEVEMNNFVQVVFPNMSVKLFQNKRGVEFFYTTDKNNGMIKSKDNLLNAKMASGFEKAILSIAFKVALCKAYNLRFAFMDEIDQAGTEENSAALFRAILSNDLFDQLFVISHKPTVRDAIQSFAPSLKTLYVNKGHFSLDE